MVSIEPGYIALYHSGELERRANALEARLASCDICPRECHVDRLEDEPGYCRSGRLPSSQRPALIMVKNRLFREQEGQERCSLAIAI